MAEIESLESTHMLKRYYEQFKNLDKFSKNSIMVILLLIVATPLLVTIIRGQASSTDSTRVEGESGVLSNAFLGTDPAASPLNGTNNYVQFGGGTTSGGTFPPDQVKLQALTVQSMPEPGYLQQVADPTFGGNSLITRVADVTAFSASTNVLTHLYSKVEPWNADGSLILLNYNYWGAGDLIDGGPNGYKFLRHINIPNGEHSGRWSNVNPDNLYGVTNGISCGSTSTNTYNGTSNQLVVTHPKSDTKTTPTVTVLHTFSNFDSCGSMSFGLEEGNLSNDDSFGVVVGWSSMQNSWGITTFTMSNTNTQTPTVAEKATYWFGSAGGSNNNPGSAGWNNVETAPKGDGALVQWNATGNGLHQGIEWYDPNLTTVKHVTSTVSHWDVGLDARGNEVAVTGCSQPGGSSTNLCDGVAQTNGSPFLALYTFNGAGPTGQNINLYPVGYPSLTQTIHVSCRNQYLRPGWCYISDMSNNPSTPIGYEQTYALKLDGSQTVEVFGVDHGSYNTCNTCNQYTARSVPYRDGTRLLFDSDWGQGTSSPAYDYELQWKGSLTSATPTPTPPCSVTPPTGTGTDTLTTTVPTTGTYTVWTRMQVPVSGNSYYYKIGNNCPQQVTDTIGINQWNWVPQGSVQLTSGQSYTVTLTGNQTGVKVDELILSQTCTPTGDGSNCLSVPTLTPTPIIPTPTPVPPTPTLTLAPSPTPTAVPSATPTLTPTPKPTSTPIPTIAPPTTTPTPKPTSTPVPTIAPPTPTTATCTPNIGDLNSDGIIDLTDFSIFAKDYGKTTAQLSNPKSDLNCDGIVDLTDFSIFAAHYGT